MTLHNIFYSIQWGVKGHIIIMRRAVGGGYVKRHMEGMQCSMFMMKNEWRRWFRCERIWISTCDNKELGWLASNVIPSMNDHIGNVMNCFGTLKEPQQHIMEVSGFAGCNNLYHFIT